MQAAATKNVFDCRELQAQQRSYLLLPGNRLHAIRQISNPNSVRCQEMMLTMDISLMRIFSAGPLVSLNLCYEARSPAKPLVQSEENIQDYHTFTSSLSCFFLKRRAFSGRETPYAQLATSLAALAKQSSRTGPQRCRRPHKLCPAVLLSFLFYVFVAVLNDASKYQNCDCF